MNTTIFLCFMISFQKVSVYSGDIRFSPKQAQEQNYFFASGDTIVINASFIRKTGSSWGCLAPILSLFAKGGDDVSEIALSLWNSSVISQYVGRQSVEIKHFTQKGGSFTILLSNTSAHKQKIYNLNVSRIPTLQEYIHFETTFKADTLYDTTWVEEPVYETLYDTTYVSKGITETQYEDSLVCLKTTDVTLDPRGKYYTMSYNIYQREISFQLPFNSTGKVAYAIFTDKERFKEFQKKTQESLQATRGLVKGTETVLASAGYPTFGLLTGLFDVFSSPGSKAFDYRLVDNQNISLYRSGAGFYCKDEGGGVTDVLTEKTISPGKWYYLCLSNPKGSGKKSIHVEISTVLRISKVIRRTIQVPMIDKREVFKGNVKVPHVKMRVVPKFKGKEE